MRRAIKIIRNKSLIDVSPVVVNRKWQPPLKAVVALAMDVVGAVAGRWRGKIDRGEFSFGAPTRPVSLAPGHDG